MPSPSPAGLGAILVPPLAGLVTTIFLGWLFLITGFAGVIFTFGAREAPGFVWALLSSCWQWLTGRSCPWNPLQGLVTLTYVFEAFFIFDGIVIIALAISHRSELSAKWEWLLVNGIVDFVLAGIDISGLPGPLAWALGLQVGIDPFIRRRCADRHGMEARKT